MRVDTRFQNIIVEAIVSGEFVQFSLLCPAPATRRSLVARRVLKSRTTRQQSPALASARQSPPELVNGNQCPPEPARICQSSSIPARVHQCRPRPVSAHQGPSVISQCLQACVSGSPVATDARQSPSGPTGAHKPLPEPTRARQNALVVAGDGQIPSVAAKAHVHAHVHGQV
jgi:hypothetical protein